MTVEPAATNAARIAVRIACALAFAVPMAVVPMPAPAAVAGAAAGVAAAPGPARRLRLATWNLEWLMLPATFDRLARNCTPKGLRVRGPRRSIPCDLVPDKRWDDAALARLAGYARGLDYDVVALQETDGAGAAARVFPGYGFCFTGRRHVQNNGFAIRAGIPFRCNADYRPLGLTDDTVRWGADVTLHPGTPRELRLLSVHLKSGCQRDPLTTPSEACEILARQVPALERWIDARAREGVPFAVLGDFNRRFDGEFAPSRDEAGRIVAMWPEIDDGVPPGADLTDPGAGTGAAACRAGERSRMPIDHVVLGATLAAALVSGSFRHERYPRDAAARWPDHCPVGVTLDLGRL